MKFEFNSEEFDILIMSLIRRRTNVKELAKMNLTASSVAAYARELEVVEGILEKLSPGSVKAIRQTEASA